MLRPPADHNPRTQPVLDFPDKSMSEMTPTDYVTLGFMAGLEAHQQIETRGKLFCRCPAGVRTTRVDAEVLRHMRPTLSELGEYDGTALMEFKTRKEIVYRLERGSVCTYEMDDTPPFPMDEEAIDVALRIARICDLNLVSELHVMRKQYLDGSIPTGFQRTAMVGLSGVVPFRDSELGPGRELRIRQLSLEEDSCREVSDIGHRIVFRTDRLGMPLTETVTEPDLLTPMDVRTGGELLAALARASGRVRRGAGAARQDVNVSVAGGRRVEIKGFPSLRRVPPLVHNEAFRQLELLRIRHELARRGVTRESLALPADGLPWERSPLVAEVGSLAKGSDLASLTDALEQGETVCAIRLPGFAGILVRRTQPGVTFARELSGRVRVIACLKARPFMLHSDLADYGLSSAAWRSIRGAAGAEPGDAVVVVWGPRADVATAAREVLARAAEALVGVPAETRQAYPDLTTGFERILPGPDRMYPDTDTPPLPITDARVAVADLDLPEPPWARRERYEALGLALDVARKLASAPWADLFDALAPPSGVVARRIAEALARHLPAWWRDVGDGSAPSPAPASLSPLVAKLGSGEIHPSATGDAVARLLRRGVEEPEAVLARYACDDAEGALEDSVAAVLAMPQRAELEGKAPAAVLRWAMGEAMPKLLGTVAPARVAERLRQALGLVQEEEAA